jgi:hypothetical protein
LALRIDYLAADETGDQAKDDPANDAHCPQETMLSTAQKLRPFPQQTDQVD